MPIRTVTFNEETGEVTVSGTNDLGGVYQDTYGVGDAEATAALGKYSGVLAILWDKRPSRKRENVKVLESTVDKILSSGGKLSDRKLQRIQTILQEAE